jgi:hypothetical protein
MEVPIDAQDEDDGLFGNGNGRVLPQHKERAHPSDSVSMQ